MSIILSLAHPSLRYPPSVRLSLSLWSRIAEHRRRLKQIRLSGSVLLYCMAPLAAGPGAQDLGLELFRVRWMRNKRPERQLQLPV